MTRVLHVLDHSLPLHSGYTFRTRAILKAQQALGLDVRGITGLRHMADGFYEVWLADKATKKMLSVGVLDATDHGTFDIPDGLDLTEYRVVDVSLESFDGNPLHSAVSVVRGTFPA